MANKLRGGTLKLDETSVQVGEMTIVAQEKQVVVAQAKTECEELLVTIVADKRLADDQEKQVSAEAAKIGRDAEEANAIAAEPIVQSITLQAHFMMELTQLAGKSRRRWQRLVV